MRGTGLILGAAFALAGCDHITGPFETVSAACFVDAQRILASSPLTGWERDKALGQTTASCLQTKGFAIGAGDGNVPLRCMVWGPDGPYGAAGGYVRYTSASGCWKRQGWL